jgi:hypothetical protein
VIRKLRDSPYESGQRDHFPKHAGAAAPKRILR